MHVVAICHYLLFLVCVSLHMRAGDKSLCMSVKGQRVHNRLNCRSVPLSADIFLLSLNYEAEPHLTSLHQEEGLDWSTVTSTSLYIVQQVSLLVVMLIWYHWPFLGVTSRDLTDQQALPGLVAVWANIHDNATCLCVLVWTNGE